VHTTMIVLHAAAGVTAFVAGCLALSPPAAERRARGCSSWTWYRSR
jgi:hypothetical protein